MSSRAGLIALLLALAAGSCRLAGAAGADCLKDDECDETEQLGCWQGTCQRLSAAAGPLAFEVIPRTSLGLEPTTFSTDAVDNLELSVCPPSPVVGQVELPAEYPLDITATATTTVPGLERRRTFTLPAEQGTGRRSFAFALPPATWRLRFTSRDGASPPLATTVEVGCTALAALDVTASGLFVRDLPVRFGPGPVGRCGAAVQALDAATGEPVSAVVESVGDGESCPDRLLRLYVDPVDQILDLVLRVRPAGGSGAVPSRDLRVRSYPGTGGVCPPDTEPPCDTVATIDLLPPDGGVPAYLAPVTVEVQDDDGLPVTTVERIAATGLLDGLPSVCGPADPTRCGWGGAGGPAIFAASEEGPGPLLSIPLLLPGRYAFTVVPASGPFAISTSSEAAVSTDEPVRLRLARKSLVNGTVTFEGKPLRSLVRAEPSSHDGRPAWMETGDDGRYELALDPGPYRLAIQPRDRFRSAPWGSLDLPADRSDDPFDVAMPSRARVRGRLVGSGVGEAVVRAFQCRPDCTSPGAVAIPVGETIAAADGSFALLVPGI